MTFDSMMALAAFAAAMTGTPGPANLSLMASGAAVGFVRSALFLIGVWLGFCVVLAATAAGLGALLAASSGLYAGLKIAGFAYICFLAVQLFRMTPESGSQTADARRLGWLDGAIIVCFFVVIIWAGSYFHKWIKKHEEIPKNLDH